MRLQVGRWHDARIDSNDVDKLNATELNKWVANSFFHAKHLQISVLVHFFFIWLCVVVGSVLEWKMEKVFHARVSSCLSQI